MMYGRMCSALRAAAGRPVALGATVLAMVGAPALAQQQGGQWDQEQQWEQREQQVGRAQQRQLQRDRQQDRFQQDQTRRSTMRQQGMGQTGGQPSNWVRIDVDVDNDGNPDGVEYIHIADLRQALSMSDSRMQREGGMGDFQQTRRGMQMDREFQSQRTQPRQDSWQQDRFQQEQYRQDRFNQQQYRPQQRQQQGEWEQWEAYRESDTRRRPMQGQRGMIQDEYYRGGFEQEASGAAMQGAGSSQTVRGEIQNLDTVRLAGVQDRHVIATIETDRGQKAHVDLGPEDRLRELDLNQGSTVELRGTSGQINNRPVLMATQIRSEGRTLNVSRTAGLGNVNKFEGEVVQTWDDTLQHNNRLHTLALVRLDQGSTVVIDLGPAQQLRRVDLNQGDKVSILGEPGRIDGQNALLAKSVAKEGGDAINIDRPDRQRDLRTQQGIPRQNFQQRGGPQQEFEDDSMYRYERERYNMNR